MLEDLHVKDIALLREGWLEFGPGLTVLTGETGAGKTALLSALKLLVGERGSQTMVRAGASELLAEARFFGASVCDATSNTSATGTTHDKGSVANATDDEMLVRRRMTADGRSKCAIDDEMATVGALAQRVGPLLDLHGQHEHQTLLTPASHVSYLDQWIGGEAAAAKSAYRGAKDAYAHALEKLAAVEAAVNAATEEVELHRIALRDIEAAALVEGEYEQLIERLPRLQHGEQLAETASTALAALRSDGGAIEALTVAHTALDRASELDGGASALVDRIASVQTDLEDIASEVRSYTDSIEVDAFELQRVLDRLSVLDGLIKRYGPRMSDVFERYDHAQQALAITQDSGGAIEAAERACSEAKAALTEEAAALANIRAAAAPAFTAAVNEAMADLEMSGASIAVDAVELPFEHWTAEGSQKLEFVYAPSPATQPRPLAKIASGGEISRVMLALKGVLSEADKTPTLVFDEVDAGIGGATAQKVGARLKELSTNHQVIVVTHLAQVAAFADGHILVEKHEVGGDVETLVRTISGEERIQELARMLSGSTDDTAIAHARTLVEQAR